ncbi:MAG: 4-hydroxy-tetrahydrodipicolinate synthase [Ferruginibacter sp.]|nr:4-hydroxy-tetrahydrodipicolinate synthase [Ferruginibacter sp.]
MAIVTPFNKNREVDFYKLSSLIEFIIGNGVQYIVTLGTTGETPVLTKEEKINIIQHTFKQVNGRIPIVVGLGGNDTAALIHELQVYPLEQAAAVLSVAPYYSKPSQQGIYLHYKTIADHSPKPVLLYNVPSRTGRNMSTETILKLANDCPNIIGIKEAGGDMQQCMDILRGRPKDFLVLSGDDALALPQIACGMDGVISVAANAYPKEFSSMVQLALKQDFIAARKINDALIPAYQYMFEENNPAGVKAFLYELGLIDNELRLPLVPLSESIYKKISEYVKGAK